MLKHHASLVIVNLSRKMGIFAPEMTITREFDLGGLPPERPANLQNSTGKNTKKLCFLRLKNVAIRLPYDIIYVDCVQFSKNSKNNRRALKSFRIGKPQKQA
jgi:hypothetical protein